MLKMLLLTNIEKILDCITTQNILQKFVYSCFTFCNTPKKPNNLKVENSIMKQQGIFYEKIKIHRHSDRQHT